MADSKISALPAATTPLAGTEVLPIVQSGTTKKVSVDNLTTGKAVSGTTFTSTVITGTPPLTVASTTEVTNLRSATSTSADVSNAVKSNATTGILQVVGPIAASTRVMTIPDANFTAARTDASQSFTGVQTFLGSGGQNVRVYGGSAAHQWDIYGSGSNLRFSDNTGIGYVQFDADNYLNNGNLVIGTAGKGIDFSAAGGDVLAQYDEVTSASTACQNAITTACVWKLTKIGNQVTITLPKVTGTAAGANVNFVLGANIPAAYRPSADIGFYGASVINNGVATAAPGYILITTSGTIIVYRDTSGLAVWTAAATAGLNESIGISWTI